MQSLKLYKNLFSLRPNIQYIRYSRSFIKSRGVQRKSNLTKYVAFGVTGSVASYGLCAIWEFENVLYSFKNKRLPFSDWAISVLGRPLRGGDSYWAIAAINAAVFIFLKVKVNMWPLFAFHKNSHYSALLLSMFSHVGLFHIFMNMYVLHSFQTLINHDSAPHFVALYMTGGFMSGLGSILYKMARGLAVPSMGASGAVLSVIAAYSVMFPNLRLGIPILSDVFNFSFTTSTGIAGLVVFDLCGLLFWRNSAIDHACHLSAVAFGLFYGYMGKQMFWDSRKKWMKWYYSVRMPSK